MMNWAKWNEPYDIIRGFGGFSGSAAGATTGFNGSMKACFFILTFDATAAGPSGATITGTTYDPTNHYTTIPAFSTVAGKTLKDLWDVKTIHQILFNGGSSDTQVQTAASTGETGIVVPEWVESSKYIKLWSVGVGGTADPLTSYDAVEIDNTAGAMSALRFTGILFGS